MFEEMLSLSLIITFQSLIESHETRNYINDIKMQELSQGDIVKKKTGDRKQQEVSALCQVQFAIFTHTLDYFVVSISLK